MVVPPATGGGVPATTASRSSPVATTPNAQSKAAKIASQTAPGTLNGPPSGNNHAVPLSARRADPMDLSTVPRRGQPGLPTDEPKQNRLFGIPDAPTYRPTEEEFRDPMEYMRKIAPEGSKYGIVKIIPPDSWNPLLAINTERFHFRTRRQELNSVEGGNRVNNDYLDQLAKFHKQHGHNLNRFPSVDKRPLDLYRLKKTVERKGGFDQVCKGKRWAEVGRDLGYSGKIMSSLSTSLKNSYQKWLLPYEEYLRLAKPGVQHQLEMMNGGPFTPSPGPSPAKKSQTSTPMVIKDETPTVRASSALNASINGDSLHQPVASHETSHLAPAATSGGFTAVNAGGFTAVNTQTPTGSFTSVNGTNGVSHSQGGTPQPTVNSPSGNGPVAIAPHPNGNISSLKRHNTETSPDDIDGSGRRSKRLRRDAPVVVGSNMQHSRMGTPRPQQCKDRGSYKPGELCEGCGKPDDAAKRLLCETCDNAYHMYCLDPPLKQRPEYEWHCPRCLVGTNEYGFEDGDVYSLVGFQRKANEFKKYHFSSIPKPYNPFKDGKQHLTEDDVEREFWRLVEDMNDTVEVEYGADIHSTIHGSGFPTIEKQPRDPYSTDPWNLNIWPLDKESLFRHIKSDISGMTVPWLYVGMVFSTFCWHNEDHFAYSANYQHLGETKTWYGIPAEDTEKFEQAMREEVPELFETQPDILFQLVTLAKPEKLRKAGVRVFAIDQHAGQFVITFPKAYHAGFNHGFNLNEAVNFAPPDWEPFGEEGVRRLKDYRKQPCFSHDELLMTAASSGGYNIKTAKWLAPALERMRNNEANARRLFLERDETRNTSQDSYLGPRYQAAPETIDAEQEEEEVVCAYCKSYCYLSQFLCKKTGKIMCLTHAGQFECCDALEFERYSGQNGDHVLMSRMTDEQLDSIVRKVVDKASIPETWMTKVDGELEDNPRPSLKHLRTLLSEGEKIQYDLPQLPDLRRFVERCNEWVEEATNYITRKQQNRRKNEKAWRKGSAKAAELEERDKELRNVENIRNLLESADNLSFDCQEINTLRERAEAITEFQREAQEALENIRGRTTQEFEDLVERGREFNVDIPEIDALERLLKRLQWDDLARANRPSPDMMRQERTLQDIERFIRDGLEIGVPENNPDILFFREHKAQGELWEQKAKELMAVEQVHYQQLDALSRQAATLPVTTETLAAVDAILKKQREVQDKIIALYEQSKHPDFRKRPMYKDVREVMTSLEELQSKPSGTVDLEREQRRHEDWMRRGKKLFGKANAPLHILHQHMQIVEQRNESCFDLRDKPRMPVEPSSRANSPEEGAERGGTDGSSSSRDVFCICRRPEAGMMIECELCHEWYHGKCLKIARGKVKEDDKYTCPICDWRVKIPRDAARPKLEDLQGWQEELDTLPFQPEEEQTLANIVDHGQAFRDFLRPYINPIATSPEEVGTLRFHLRKIEGADILLSYETNHLRQELHKWAPVAPDAPPLIEASQSTRKPRPTKQQKIMAQLGITNPEDLPQQYKIKPHIAKRKQSDAFGGKTVPLQPATTSSSPAPQTPGGILGLPTAKPKPGLTALAIQVLGPLAGAPVAQKMLAAEPHMNREKLEKMRTILAIEPHNTGDDVDAFSAKIAALPHMPAFGYEINHKSTPTPTPTTSTYRDQSLFPADGSPAQSPGTAADDTGVPPRLASPARFSASGHGHHHFHSHAHPSPPSPHFGGAGMFEGPNGAVGMGSMFDSPSGLHVGGSVGGLHHDTKPAVTTPGGGVDFGVGGMLSTARGGGIFDSPRPGGGSLAQAGLGSPGFDGSQQSAGGNIDNVFADLVNDQDGDGVGMDGNGGGEADGKEEKEGEDEGEREREVLAGMSQVDPAITGEATG